MACAGEAGTGAGACSSHINHSSSPHHPIIAAVVEQHPPALTARVSNENEWAPRDPETGEWHLWALELGAKKRNEIIQLFNIDTRDAAELKKLSRRHKQNSAQARYHGRNSKGQGTAGKGASSPTMSMLTQPKSSNQALKPPRQQQQQQSQSLGGGMQIIKGKTGFSHGGQTTQDLRSSMPSLAHAIRNRNGEWIAGVLTCGAKERNIAIKQHRLTTEEGKDLKTTSRRMKQALAQRRFASSRKVSQEHAQQQHPP